MENNTKLFFFTKKIYILLIIILKKCKKRHFTLIFQYDSVWILTHQHVFQS